MSATPKIRTQSTFPTTLTIDDVAIAVRVKRMTRDDFDVFAEGFAAWGSPRGPEETPEARKQREVAATAWMRASLDAYFSIVPGEFEHDGREITKGGDLLDIYGGRQDDVIAQALGLVYGENTVSEKKKESYRLRLVSLCGSTDGLPPTASGDEADSTAASADAQDSTADAGVTAPQNEKSSGTTDPSA